MVLGGTPDEYWHLLKIVIRNLKVNVSALGTSAEAAVAL